MHHSLSPHRLRLIFPFNLTVTVLISSRLKEKLKILTLLWSHQFYDVMSCMMSTDLWCQQFYDVNSSKSSMTSSVWWLEQFDDVTGSMMSSVLLFQQFYNVNSNSHQVQVFLILSAYTKLQYRLGSCCFFCCLVYLELSYHRIINLKHTLLFLLSETKIWTTNPKWTMIKMPSVLYYISKFRFKHTIPGTHISYMIVRTKTNWSYEKSELFSYTSLHFPLKYQKIKQSMMPACFTFK